MGSQTPTQRSSSSSTRIAGIEWSVSEARAIRHEGTVQVIRPSQPSERIRSLQAMFHIVRNPHTPSQAAAALTRLVQLMSPRGALPPIGAGTGEESVEATPRKRKSETPAQAKQRLDAQKQAALERYRKQQQERATRSAERASKSVPPVTETTPVAATGATGQGAVSNHKQVEQGQVEPDHNERSIDRSSMADRSVVNERAIDRETGPALQRPHQHSTPSTVLGTEGTTGTTHICASTHIHNDHLSGHSQANIQTQEKGQIVCPHPPQAYSSEGGFP